MDLWQCLVDKNQFQGLSSVAQRKVDLRVEWSSVSHSEVLGRLV